MLRKSRSGIESIGFSIAFFLVSSFSVTSLAEHDIYVQDDSAYQTGMKVFSDYCARCHGEHADGRGKAVPLYVKMRQAHPSNFHMKFYSYRPKEYLVNIIRDGGKKHSLSEYMPPFGEELSNEQINNVVHFIQKVSLYTTATNEKSKMAQAEKEK